LGHSVEGNERPESAGIIQGGLIKFSNEATWISREGDELPGGLELVPVDVWRLVQKWKDQAPIETIILEPHQKFPDIEKMNAETSKSEWVEGPDGQLGGPWQGQHVLYLLDPKTMDKYTFPTGTVGGRIAIRDLRDKIQWMRRLRGNNVYPVVKLADVFMNTRFGGRQRPHFIVVRWVRLGGGGGAIEALPSPEPSPPTSTAATSQSDLPLSPVQEPSLREELDDDIPDFGDSETKAKPEAPPVRPTDRRDLKKPTARVAPARRRRAG
jgi:hypothetical protein